MGEKDRFYVVWDADEGKPVDTTMHHKQAVDLASQTAKDRLGSTIVVFEPKEAFRAEAVTDRVYLNWPTVSAPAVTPPTEPTAPMIDVVPTPQPPADDPEF